MAAVPLISLEDHYVSASLGEQPSFDFNLFPAKTRENLRSLGKARIEALDRGGVSIQVASLIPVTESLSLCRASNDQCATVIAESGSRLKGFAALPMVDPELAAEELARCVRELKFLGALIPNHANGVYYDGPEYRVFWKMAQALDVPIYLHPCPPVQDEMSKFQGPWPSAAQAAFSTYVWGWHADVGLHYVRLYNSGLFEPDVCPNLKLVIGHAGEMVPFMLARANRFYDKVWTENKPRRTILEVWTQNTWVTLSGMWDLAPFVCLLKTTGVDKIMYSNDWPIEDEVEGKDFMTEIQQSGLVTVEEYEMIAYKNAQKLLKLDPASCP